MSLSTSYITWHLTLDTFTSTTSFPRHFSLRLLLHPVQRCDVTHTSHAAVWQQGESPWINITGPTVAGGLKVKPLWTSFRAQVCVSLAASCAKKCLGKKKKKRRKNTRASLKKKKKEGEKKLHFAAVPHLVWVQAFRQTEAHKLLHLYTLIHRLFPSSFSLTHKTFFQDRARCRGSGLLPQWAYGWVVGCSEEVQN